MTGQPEAVRDHEAVPADFSAYTMDGPNTGCPANLANARHFPAEALCVLCGGVIRLERMYHAEWEHTGRSPGDPAV